VRVDGFNVLKPHTFLVTAQGLNQATTVSFRS